MINYFINLDRRPDKLKEFTHVFFKMGHQKLHLIYGYSYIFKNGTLDFKHNIMFKNT